MNHIFDVEVAKEYGVDEAVLISHFTFWITHNAANKKNFHDGRYWTYNSYNAIAVIFPYWSAKQIRRILGNLLEKGVLMAGNFNQKDYDLTKWYAFTDEPKWLGMLPMPTPAQMGKGYQPDTSAHLGSTPAVLVMTPAQMGKAIPDTLLQIDNTDNKKKKKTTKDEATASPPVAAPEMGNSKPADLPPPPPPLVPPPEDENGWGEKWLTDRFGARKKGEQSLYNVMVATYYHWFESPQVAGVKPVMGKGEFKAIKDIIKYFLDVTLGRNDKRKEMHPEHEPTRASVEAETNAAWHNLLQGLSSNAVEQFYRKQTKPTQILSNLQNIIIQLKDAIKTRMGQTTTQTGTGPAKTRAGHYDDLERQLDEQMGAGTGNP